MDNNGRSSDGAGSGDAAGFERWCVMRCEGCVYEMNGGLTPECAMDMTHGLDCRFFASCDGGLDQDLIESEGLETDNGGA